ncbi:MAG TPA: helix-turn-helix domain-containing protein, partial [Longimicrobium sp.]|nr:helix-turn-helix domain-containing protein [Longimicrobium sp.]
MRFQFLKPRKDVASAEQVRALRERRGWTLEQLADEVHASALEVSAWEAGAVAVPSRQALLIRWHTERLAWADALVAVRGELCSWARENAPDPYDRILRNPASLRYPENAAVLAHVAGCVACQAALARARQIGGHPPKPDTSDSLRARYWRWLDRLPDRAQWPFMVAGLAVGSALPVSFVAFWALDLWVGLLLGWAAFWATARVTSRGLAGLPPVLAGFAAGLLGWSTFPGNTLTDPRPWQYVAGLGVVMGVGQLMGAMTRKRKARALVAGGAPAPALSPPAPDLAATLQRVTQRAPAS